VDNPRISRVYAWGVVKSSNIHAIIFVSNSVQLAEQFQPELVLVSAGQDPSAFDPMGRMMVADAGFKQFTVIVKAIAERHCKGKLVVCHEGGYSAAYVPFCTLRVIEELCGKNSKVVEDPFQLGVEALPTEVLEQHQRDVVARVKKIHADHWKFA
jgi:acetoin utilization deacetylase AcuC-like enzyme